ncbi:hypothetical protein AVEN_149226-1 [Araneus ventricosus]|uniref:Uncharacterized protein n=1 Tax=Araneus ventricosus TaxID=182803 RepID=A0A4Y2LYW2_ARAVE|nr:hypothetical protein AVEN_149226-1 [Araneus ventricosus]
MAQVVHEKLPYVNFCGNGFRNNLRGNAFAKSLWKVKWQSFRNLLFYLGFIPRVPPTGPSRATTGPSRDPTGPSRAPTGPSRAPTGPSRTPSGTRKTGWEPLG